ncbi:axonemal dynein light intermediate polypeptide 1 [Cynoglossus semilaevis]|uniref:Axonemal dynein light intermediate polypeptide 1 n=1 Tax=Cynoglossus semilaevis TaxID=244447 RepID=A0A3P8X3S1_CYNSE|nr:axonemal dynein light intermediate polypeptide 1 [Cynoglossus semilaevis]
MIEQSSSLLKYDKPVLVNRSPGTKSPKGRSLRVSYQQSLDSNPVPPPPKLKSDPSESSRQENDNILNSILPPRVWTKENQTWVQQVSNAPCTRIDVVRLEELLDRKLQEEQARETGICPVRRELYSQCFDELIRQVTINCAERGLLLLRVRDEIHMTIAAYQTLYESSVAFGMRKALQAEERKADVERSIPDLLNEIEDLKKQVSEQKVRCEATEKNENNKRQTEEKRHLEEIQFLKFTNQELKTQLELIITQQK